VSDHSLTVAKSGTVSPVTCADANTRERLLDAAIALFASQGYASTTVADIQQACGLSPGSGALYKHFESKNALLREAMTRQVTRMYASQDEHYRTRPADPHEALRRGAARIVDTIQDNGDLLRVMFREQEALEGFLSELWSAVTLNAYESMGSALEASKTAGSAQVEDPEATAAVLLAGLAYFPIVQLLIRRTPGNVETDRFREAWIRLAQSVFGGTVPT